MFIACPSFIIPATRLDNVRHLSGIVDEVELLYMCSLSGCDFPDAAEVAGLAGADMRYNVHMPYDRELLSQPDWDVMAQYAEALRPLNAHTHTFHIRPDDQFFKGLEWFKSVTGLPVTLENGESDIASFELSDDDICLDVGHMLMYSQSIECTIEKYADRIRMFHLHGFDGSKDHQSIRHFPPETLRYILDFSTRKNLAVSIEVFNQADLTDSLQVIKSF